MSTNAHQMEPAQSFSSRGNSELGSQYESGFYMTSFAVTIFIGALVTAGLLLITILIALTVMLQSCQSSSSGIVEIKNVNGDYDYCKSFALHAELNSLQVEEYPLFCRNIAIRYIKEGEYATDLNFGMRMADSYFSSIAPQKDGLDVVLMDIDDIFAPLLPHNSPLTRRRYTDQMEEAKHLKHVLTLKLYLKLRSNGWALILLSRKPERERNITTKLLVSAGYTGWSSLIMRTNDELQMDSHEYFSKRRVALQQRGFRIIGVITSYMDAITGPSLGNRIFKLPNPTYYTFEEYTERKILSQ